MSTLLYRSAGKKFDSDVVLFEYLTRVAYAIAQHGVHPLKLIIAIKLYLKLLPCKYFRWNSREWKINDN